MRYKGERKEGRKGENKARENQKKGDIVWVLNCMILKVSGGIGVTSGR